MLLVPVTLSPAVADPVWGPNLIVNGGAEVGDPSLSGYSAVTIPGWQAAGTPTVIKYGTSGGFPVASAGPSDGGAQFFGGGNVATSTLTQVDSLADASTAIDGGQVHYTLSGWLGGYGLDGSAASVTVTFLASTGSALGTGGIGPVTAFNRFYATELLPRSTTDIVPVGARQARVVVTFTDSNPSLGNYNDAYADNLSLTLDTAMPAPSAPLPPPSNVGTLDHVFMVYLENHGTTDIVGSPNAPYINSLINNNGYGANYYALTHPSDPNYYPILGGSDFGLRTNCAVDCINAPNLADSIEAAGKTWAAYEESMPTPCATTSSGNYVPDELPFMAFHDIVTNSARCTRHVLPLTQMATDLASTATTPNYAWFAGNSCDNMEGCNYLAEAADKLGSHQYDVAQGDAFLASVMATIENSPAWATQRCAVFITWDEDYDNTSLSIDNQGNHVPMIVVASPHSGMRQGAFVATSYGTHYSLLRTIEEALGLPPLTNNDRYATPLNDYWPAS